MMMVFSAAPLQSAFPIVSGNHDIIPPQASSTLEMNLAPRTQQASFGFICLRRWRNILGSDEEKRRWWGGEGVLFSQPSKTQQSFWILTWEQKKDVIIILPSSGMTKQRQCGECLPMRETPPRWENDSDTKGCNVITSSFWGKQRQI